MSFVASDGCTYNILSSSVILMELPYICPSSLVLDTVTKDGITYQITSFRLGIFVSKSNLNHLTIINITTIPEGAFLGCNNLQSITLPNVISLPIGIFSNLSSLSNVYIPKLLIIPAYAMSACNMLTTISFPEATEVGEGAFSVCSKLSSVSLPKVISIGVNAFSQCSGLLTMNNTNPTGNIHIPNIQTIGDFAFSQNTFTYIRFPPTIKSIGHGAFLKFLMIPVHIYFMGQIPDIALGVKVIGTFPLPDGCCFSRVNMSDFSLHNDIATVHYYPTYYNDRLLLLFSALVPMTISTISLVSTNAVHNTMNLGSGTVRNYRAKYKRV